jgi:hypothetical protein
MLLIVLNLAFSCLAIWISLKAQSLGSVPYRWGVYVGMSAVWTSLLLLASSVNAFSAGLCIIALLAAASGVGILQRKRWGVALYGLMYAALIAMSPWLASVPGEPFLMTVRDSPSPLSVLVKRAESFTSVIALLFFCGYLVGTFVYFRNRWSLLRRSS